MFPTPRFTPRRHALRTMPGVRPVDGEACVNALLRAGFHVQHRGQGVTLLRREGRVVAVPAVEVVSRHLLLAILRSAGMTEQELEQHLPRPRMHSGTFSRPDVDAPPSSTGNGTRR